MTVGFFLLTLFLCSVFLHSSMPPPHLSKTRYNSSNSAFGDVTISNFLQSWHLHSNGFPHLKTASGPKGFCSFHIYIQPNRDPHRSTSSAGINNLSLSLWWNVRKRRLHLRMMPDCVCLALFLAICRSAPIIGFSCITI